MLNWLEISYTRAVLGTALLLAAIIGLLLPAQNPVRAQDIMRIAAVVNDDVISIYDLTNRLALVALSSGLQLDQETRQRLLPQVMRSMIDEKLQIQESNENDVFISDEELDGAFARVAQTEVPHNIISLK